ncbi:hypothetical protein Cgig2_001452 [Carnegiea gigantea]|uniref:Uncharacterized protein n=1 Tax=Carnegiea gigantea TaxID=171969 RepID=A0A9Q1KVX5_9CARY|nr:hypothetical protein Cgig2_001452 [Carnegiea gigantea]
MISHSRWISPYTSSVGSRNLQQGHVFLCLSQGRTHIQWNKWWHGSSHTSLPSLISSLHITHSVPPPLLTATDGRATTTSAAAATSLPASPLHPLAPTNLMQLSMVSTKAPSTSAEVLSVNPDENFNMLTSTLCQSAWGMSKTARLYWWTPQTSRRRRTESRSRKETLRGGNGGGGEREGKKGARRCRKERRWRATRRDFWGRGREWRWLTAIAKRDGEERREMRRCRWWWKVEEREAQREESWEEERVERAAMMMGSTRVQTEKDKTSYTGMPQLAHSVTINETADRRILKSKPKEICQKHKSAKACPF